MMKDQLTASGTAINVDNSLINEAVEHQIETDQLPMTDQAWKNELTGGTATEDCDKSETGEDEKKSSSQTMKKDNPPTVALIPPLVQLQGNRDARDSVNQNEFRYEGPMAPHSTPISINPSIVLLEAELVTPPVEAYHVSIDEDQIRPAHATFQAMPFDVEESQWNDGRGKKSLWQSISRSKYSLGFSIALGFVIVGVICAITIPIVLMSKGQVDNATFPGMDVMPTQSPTYPYPCYTSTVDILRAQMMLDEPIPEAFIVCPNTVIKIGRLKDQSSNDFSFIDGDYPIIPIHKNVKILCGIDGRWENNCTLDGGLVQLVTLQQFPSPDDGSWQSIDTPVHNFTVSGFTFTGRMLDQPPFQGISILLSHPAENVHFEDCRWIDISPTQALIGLYRNTLQVLFNLPLEGQTIDATFSNCMFENIIFDFPLFFIWNQSITVERTIFRDISVSAVQQFCGIGREEETPTVVESTGTDVCSSLLLCGPGSNCTMNDICVFDFANESPAMVQVVNGSAAFHYDRLFADDSRSESCDLNHVTLSGDYIRGSNDCSTIFTQETCSAL